MPLRKQSPSQSTIQPSDYRQRLTYRVSRPPVCWRFVRCVEEFAAHIVSVLVFFNHFWQWLCAVTVKRLSFMWRAKSAGALLRCGQQTAHSEEAVVCEDYDERMCPGVEHVPVQPLTRLRRKPPWRRRAAWHTASRGPGSPRCCDSTRWSDACIRTRAGARVMTDELEAPGDRRTAPQIG